MYIIKNKAGKLQVLCGSDCFEQQMISEELRVGVLVPRALWSIVIMKTKVMDQQFIDLYVPLMGGIVCFEWVLLAFSQ